MLLFITEKFKYLIKTGYNLVMASISVFDHEASSSNVEKKIETKETDRPGVSSGAAKLQSPMSSKVDSDEESNSNDTSEEMETTEKDETPGISKTHERPYKCPQCPKKYKNKCHMKRHRKVHDENKRFKCDYCVHKIFATKQDYDRHMRSHTGEKPHECPTCHRCFGLLTNLKDHQYTHLEKKTFKCTKCPVARYFQSPNQLRNHMIIHKQEKLHKCSICDKGFHLKRTLERHEVVHTNLKQFQCGSCMKVFSRVDTMNRHIQKCAKLMEKKKYKCPQCPKRYAHKKVLNAHMKIHQNKETTK